MATIAFGELFAPDSDRGEVVVTFLALLEMIRLNIVRALQAERFGPINIRLGDCSLADACEVVRALAATGRGGGVQNGAGNGNGRGPDGSCRAGD